MIQIQELKSKKCVGKTSIFVSFNYRDEIVKTLKTVGDFNYDEKTKLWEFPINKFPELVTKLTVLDDISVEEYNPDAKEVLTQKITHKYDPFDYQYEGIDWLINNDNGLLLDAPGLGKTLQVIYAAEELKLQKGVKHCLIICGINILKHNWKNEINKFSTESCIIIGERINSKGNLTYTSVKDRAEQLYNKIDEFFIILNVESLRDPIVVDAIKNSVNEFDMIVFDEVHKAKSPTTSQGKSLLKLAKVGRYHYGLTGTILVNSPLDAFMPLKFIGYENSTYTNFKNFYCVMSHKFGHFQIEGYRNLELLKDSIADCSIRRDKSILNLPPKVIIPEYIDMSPEQVKFYEELQSGIVIEADRVNIKKDSLLGLVTRLRQAATCPELLTSKPMVNSKIERAKDLIDEITSSGEKVIVFSTFKEPLYQLYNYLGDRALLCTGDQSDSEVNNNKDMFQEDDEHKVILCTTSKMGTGLTLTRANYEIFLDSTWTDSLETQCEDRAYRVGTTQSVTIYKLIAIGTIDERIQDILKRKRAVSDYIIDNNITAEVDELKELLGIKTLIKLNYT